MAIDFSRDVAAIPLPVFIAGLFAFAVLSGLTQWQAALALQRHGTPRGRIDLLMVVWFVIASGSAIAVLLWYGSRGH